MRKKTIVILGGGLAGLSAAEKLLDSDKFEIIILEKAPFLGGLASSFEIDGERIPRFNHHIIRSNTTTLRYLEKFNLMGNNVWKKIKMAFAVNGKIYNINTPAGLLKFNYLSLWGRFRLGLFGAYLIFLLNPEKMNPELDAETWLRKLAGKEVTEKIWYNLYARNKFNIPLNQINAKQFANRLYEKEGYDDFTFPSKGIQGIIDGLEKNILDKGGEIHIGVSTTSLDFDGNEIEFVEITPDFNNSLPIVKSGEYTEGQVLNESTVLQYIKKKKHKIKFDYFINTIPVPELIKLAKGIPENYVADIKKLRYTPVVGLAFATENFLDSKHYWINLFNERVHVIYQHSLIIDKYKAKVTWCVRYGGSAEDMDKSDEEIKKLYLEVIKKYFPDMKLKWCFVFRENYAEPIYDKDYVKYAPTYKTPLKQLYMAGIQVTFPKIRNMNVALESGEKVAEYIIEENEK